MKLINGQTRRLKQITEIFHPVILSPFTGILAQHDNHRIGQAITHRTNQRFPDGRCRFARSGLGNLSVPFLQKCRGVVRKSTEKIIKILLKTVTKHSNTLIVPCLKSLFAFIVFPVLIFAKSFKPFLRGLKSLITFGLNLGKRPLKGILLRLQLHKICFDFRFSGNPFGQIIKRNTFGKRRIHTHTTINRLKIRSIRGFSIA